MINRLCFKIKSYRCHVTFSSSKLIKHLKLFRFTLKIVNSIKNSILRFARIFKQSLIKSIFKKYFYKDFEDRWNHEFTMTFETETKKATNSRWKNIMFKIIFFDIVKIKMKAKVIKMNVFTLFVLIENIKHIWIFFHICCWHWSFKR